MLSTMTKYFQQKERVCIPEIGSRDPAVYKQTLLNFLEPADDK
jgi:hypothetical protein